LLADSRDRPASPALPSNTIIILHGQPSAAEYHDPATPSPASSHWIPWLQGTLQDSGVPTATPEVPNVWRAEWETWAAEFERWPLGPHTALVGHSTGAGFLVHYLSRRPDLTVGRVVLVAPWFDPAGDEPGGYFAKPVIDPGLVARVADITVFWAANDLPGSGHFTQSDLGTDAFPELLDTVLA
jgi:hypothetical protein